MDQLALDTLLDKHKTLAICLWPSWPLRTDINEVGHLGGRPCLPQGVAWPRTASGKPLHFLAMIDCGALRDPSASLPDRGVLFFFGLMDADGSFDETGSTQVLFFETSGSVDSILPDDLGATLGGYDNFSRHAGLIEDRPTPEFFRWPLEAIVVDDWPEHAGLPTDDKEEVTKAGYTDTGDYSYDIEVRRRQAAQLPRLATPDSKVWRLPSLTTLKDADLNLTDIAERPDFPQVNGMIESICRVYEHAKQRELERHKEKAAPAEPQKKTGIGGLFDRLRGTTPVAEPVNAKLEKQNRYIAVALERVEDAKAMRQKAVALGLGNAPTQRDRADFIKWLTYNTSDDARHKWNAQAAYDAGLNLALKRLGTYPDAAEKIPHALFEEYPEAPHHQMLGFGPSDLAPNNHNDALLLMLRSDDRANFMFGDAGDLCFYIDPDDLKARKFDQVYTRSTGGG